MTIAKEPLRTSHCIFFVKPLFIETSGLASGITNKLILHFIWKKVYLALLDPEKSEFKDRRMEKPE